MSKHTPGPWVLDTYGNLKVGFDYVRFSGLCLSSGQEADANTRLIAAAPDLLEALKFLMTAHGEQLDLAFEQAQSAIFKAEGKP